MLPSKHCWGGAKKRNKSTPYSLQSDPFASLLCFHTAFIHQDSRNGRSSGSWDLLWNRQVQEGGLLLLPDSAISAQHLS